MQKKNKTTKLRLDCLLTSGRLRTLTMMDEPRGLVEVTIFPLAFNEAVDNTLTHRRLSHDGDTTEFHELKLSLGLFCCNQQLCTCRTSEGSEAAALSAERPQHIV